MFRLVDGIVARAAAVDAGRDLRHRDVLLKEGVASLGRTGGGGEAWCGAGGGGGGCFQPGTDEALSRQRDETSNRRAESQEEEQGNLSWTTR